MIKKFSYLAFKQPHDPSGIVVGMYLEACRSQRLRGFTLRFGVRINQNNMLFFRAFSPFLPLQFEYLLLKFAEKAINPSVLLSAKWGENLNGKELRKSAFTVIHYRADTRMSPPDRESSREINHIAVL